MRHVYSNPERRKRATIVCFLKKYYKARAQTIQEANIVGVPSVALRFAGHRTIEMLGLVRPKV